MLILASASPRRRELLAAAGVVFEIDVADVDETPRAGEDPAAYAERVARDKAVTVAARRPGSTVLGADTVVVVDGEILGKPVDADDALRMLSRLSNRAHEVLTAVAVARAGDVRAHVEKTVVTMREIAASEAERYVASGEPMDKAGAYGIQGAASAFVTAVSGRLDTVIGLPVQVALDLLTGYGESYSGS